MWIIQEKVFGEETDKLIETLDNNKIIYKLIDNKDNTKIIINQKCIVRGSVEFVERVTNLSGKPFNLTIDNYTYTSYSKHFANRMLNSNFIILPWWTLKKSAIGIFNAFPEAEKFFIRPNSGRKIFTGTTLTKKWWSKEIDIIKSLPNSNIQDDDLVIISSFKDIEAEYRVLLHKNQIIDYCLYSGEEFNASIDKVIFKFFSETIDFFPDVLYTIDIAKTKDGYRIIEMNCGMSAGWYDMDYEKIVKFIRKKL